MTFSCVHHHAEANYGETAANEPLQVVTANVIK